METERVLTKDQEEALLEILVGMSDDGTLYTDGEVIWDGDEPMVCFADQDGGSERMYSLDTGDWC